MATRVISTRLVLDGEAEYKAGMASVNAEIRQMQSALKLTEAEYKNNATSQEALRAKSQDLNNLLAKQQEKVDLVSKRLQQARETVQKYKTTKEELTAALKKNEAELAKVAAASGKTSDEYKKLKNENERLKGELDKCEDGLASAQRAVTNLGAALNRAKTDVKNTENAIKDNSAALVQHSNRAKADAEAINALAATLAAAGLKRGLEEIAEALTACVEASIEFESAMAGVKKATDMSDEELSAMGNTIKDLSTEIPITATELAGIVEVAGQLGIAKEDLIAFATVMADLGVSTNMTSEEAATMLAQFANITQMAPENYGRLGSTIVDLGNNFATTEQKITHMAQRLAAGGKLAGLTEPQILALATAMSSVGIEAEAGGTAMTQTLTKIEQFVEEGGDKLNTLAGVAGMSAESFADAWNNRPIEAIEAFIRGLGNLDEESESTNAILDELGMTGIRQGNMLKSLALASDVLTGAIDTANSAWEQNIALTKEAETRYATTESKMQMFKNSVTNLKIAVGDQLTPAIGRLADEGSDIIDWATDFVEANEWLVPLLTAVTGGLAGFTASITGFVAVTKVAIPAIKLLNATMKANPAFAVATAVVTLGAALATLALMSENATEEADNLRDSMNDCKDTFDEASRTFESTEEDIAATAIVIEGYIARLDELNQKTALTKEEQAEYSTIVAQLRDLLPGVNIELDDTTGKLKTTTEELRLGAAAWQDYAREQAFATILGEQRTALVQMAVDLEKARMSLQEYTSAASEGALEYAAALDAERAAAEAYAAAMVESNYEETEAVIAAREAQVEAIEHTGEVLAGLSREERKAGEAISALNESIAESEAQLASQSEQLTETQARMDELYNSASRGAEEVSTIAENVQTANEALGTLGDGASESVQQIPEAVTGAMEETRGAVEAAAPEIIATVGDMGAQSASEFQAGLNCMPESARQVMSSVNQAVLSNVPTARSAGYSVGAAISQGAAQGVYAYAAQVAAAAAQMVTNAIAAAKAAAASNSPSKKMIALGQDLDRGAIIGIKDLEDEVVKAMESTMSKVVTAQVEMPKVPDNTYAMLEALQGGKSDDRLANAIDKLSKQKPSVNISVDQHFEGGETSYAGQQRAASKEMKKLARELMA